MVDPLGALITELRTANIASKRVAGFEPDAGWALPKGSYQRFVVLSVLGSPRFHRTPLQETRVGVRAYGATPQDAVALYNEISDVVDNAGPRLVGSKRIYQSLDDTGGSESKDPDTGQPVATGVVVLYAATQAA